MYELAIVIPAFKNNYFEQTLASIAKQTCKNFTLYIGDDCSPSDLQSIVNIFQDQIRIKYIRFNENIGSKDLVGHWERCIDLIEDEKWIWLFSDDDIMEPNCVEDFYNTLFSFQYIDLFRFNIVNIDGNNKVISNFLTFPNILTVEEFLKSRLQNSINSYVVEYIFRRSHFFEMGRFQNFDLGWGSDDATWIKLGKNNGIKSIEKSKVHWRASLYNISTNYKDKEILKRKFQARIEFVAWIYKEAGKNEIRIGFLQLQKLLETWFLGSIYAMIKTLSFKLIAHLLNKFYFVIGKQEYIHKKLFVIYLYKIYKMSLEIIKTILFWNFFKKKLPI